MSGSRPLLPDGAVSIVEMAFGSHVYGTSRPESDRDVKGVFLPPAQDILLGRVEETIVHSTKEDPSQANAASDVDTDFFSLKRFLGLLLEGQTNAIDMLFTPESFYVRPPHAAWREIQAHRRRFLHSGVSAFARYCHQQAAKYGLKGSRIAAFRAALDALAPLPASEKLADHADKLETLIASQPKSQPLRMKLISKADGAASGGLLDVAGKRIPMGATIKMARQRFKAALDSFGERALLAEKNEGVDWKALMHAVRVAHEAKELLLSGTVTFPRPERELLVKIRNGKLPYKEVAELIEAGVQELEQAAAASKLPAKPDFAFADELVCKYYGGQIKTAF